MPGATKEGGRVGTYESCSSSFSSKPKRKVTIAATTILGYTAMSGIIGGGGLGKIAINYGYYRYKTLVMILAVILLVILVQALQSLGTRLAISTNRKLKH